MVSLTILIRKAIEGQNVIVSVVKPKTSKMRVQRKKLLIISCGRVRVKAEGLVVSLTFMGLATA